MLIEYLIKGILVGLTASISLGPVAILVIQRTLNKGHVVGFVSGLGASFADTFFAVLAGFGVSALVVYIEEYQLYLKIAGSLILIGMGIYMIINNVGKRLRVNYKKMLISKEDNVKKFGKGLIGDFFSVFGLTLSNPIPFFIFTAFFSTFNILDTTSDSKFQTVFLVLLGVLIGTILWWFIITSIINFIRNKFKIRNLLIINRIAGILIIAFAIGVILYSVF